MWRLIMFLLFLVASVWLGLEVAHHPGYLLVVYQPWMVQMPLWFALLALIIVFGFLYVLIHCIDSIQWMWFRLKNWLRFRSEHKSYSQTQHGLAMLIEGRWRKAERLLKAGVNQSIEPLMNYLGAAKAAQEQGAGARRDEYIQKAYQAAPNAALAIGLTEAELEIEQNQLVQATAILNRLRQQEAYHPRILKLLEKIYVQQADWKNLHQLLPSMKKAKIINAEQLEVFEKNMCCELVTLAGKKNLDELHATWNGFSRTIRKHPDVVCAYVRQLLKPQYVSVGTSAQEAEVLIRQTLNKIWQPELAKWYRTLPFDNLNKQLVVAGAWLKTYGEKPELLLLLGKICTRVQLWGKAKDYFERCLAIAPNAEAAFEYGQLLEQLDDGEDALRIYRNGLSQLAEAALRSDEKI